MSTEADSLIVELRCAFPVFRERLFTAWTQAGEISQWFGPEGVRVLEARMDARPGGKFLISATGAAGEIWTAIGEYREVTPPSRLVFTWAWADIPEWQGVDSVVTVEFSEKPGGTEVHFTHERFPSADSRGRHEIGWTGSLEKLGRFVTG
jgi:uncharacterized protein YndB with AHSA1/START domain